MDRVSIIIPVYNAEKFLRETIDSCLNQTYPDIEIILVDDGSTDNSKKIIDSYKTSKIKYIYQENSGAPTARNNGYKNSTGKYIIYFDADDILIKDALEVMVSAMQQYCLDMVVGSYKVLESQDSKKTLYEDKILNVNKKNILDIAKLDPLPCNKLYKREIIENNSILFDNIEIAQDLNFFIKYLICCNKVMLLSKIVMNYRIVENSISHTYTLRLLKIDTCFNEIINFSKINHINIESEEWFQLIKLLHYTHQYTKIPKIKSFSDRVYAKKKLEQWINNCLNNIKSNDSSYSYFLNHYFSRKKIYTFFLLPYVYNIYFLIKKGVSKI